MHNKNPFQKVKKKSEEAMLKEIMTTGKKKVLFLQSIDKGCESSDFKMSF